MTKLGYLSFSTTQLLLELRSLKCQYKKKMAWLIGFVELQRLNIEGKNIKKILSQQENTKNLYFQSLKSW